MTQRQRFDDFTEAQLRQLENRWKSSIELTVDRMDARLRVIERLVWVSIGGVLVFGSIVTYLGSSILKLLK